MKPWLIHVPVWGEHYRQTFLKSCLPSLLAALDHAGRKAKFLVHTDQPFISPGLDIEFRPVPDGETPYRRFAAAQLDAIIAAKRDQPVSLMNCDNVVSVEAFAAAERRFAEGKRIIMVAGSRTCGEPPIAARSRDLLAWSLIHLHPFTADCFWRGRSSIPWAIYFRRGDDVVVRPFHLHPFAFFKDRNITALEKTADVDLVVWFKRREIHVVADADEMAVVEMSPPSLTFPSLPGPMDEASVAAWASTNTIAEHREFFARHPITIAGRGQCDEQAVCDRIISMIKTPPRVVHYRPR